MFAKAPSIESVLYFPFFFLELQFKLMEVSTVIALSFAVKSYSEFGTQKKTLR